MQYRSEIDGLRAVAVLPVILFHAGFELFSGGYIGVDVFFVISGYLITTIILTEQENGTFSILKFYERRARRIMPALFTVMIVCIPFAWSWMFPEQFKQFSRSLIAVSLFASNFLFWRETDYFAASAEEKPLLHTWSLAVEEQYYMVFPLFLIFFWGVGRRNLVLIITAVALFSLMLAEYGWRHGPTANFFLAHSRAWELLVGSLCAFWLLHRGPKRNDLLALTGLILIVLSIFLFDGSTPFPSFYTLMPVLGTAMVVLFADGPSYAGRILSNRLFVGIGLISYSAYLWHQPLFAFARIRSVYHPPEWLMLLLSLASLVLAYVTWKFIEQPFRTRSQETKKYLVTRNALFSGCVLASVLFIAFGLYGNQNDGFRDRFDPEIIAILDAKKDRNPLRERCFFSGDRLPEFPIEDCIHGDRENLRVGLWGDSHADAVAASLGSKLVEDGISMMQVTYASCPPIRGIKRTDVDFAANCHVFNDRAFEYFSDSDLDVIVLVARWPMLIEGSFFDNGEGGLELAADPTIDVIDNAQASPGEQNREARVTSHVIETLRSYLDLGKKIVLVYPIPEAGWDVPVHLARSQLNTSKQEVLSTNLAKYIERNQDAMSALDQIEHKNLVKIRPEAIYCDTLVKGRCVNSLKDGSVLYTDAHHLSNAGADLLTPSIKQAVLEALKKN